MTGRVSGDRYAVTDDERVRFRTCGFVHLPRHPHRAWQGNVFERQAASVAAQLGPAIEHRLGFTHSHNDAEDVLDSVSGSATGPP